MTGGIREWRFTAAEFDVLWRLLGRDRLPYPLQCRGVAITDAEHRASGRADARTVGRRLDEDLYDALSVLHTPDVRVEVCGFTGPGLTVPVRVHAGVRAGAGVLVRQGPGPDLDSGGAVTVTATPATELPALLVRVLPPAVRGAGDVPAATARAVGGSGGLLRPVGGRDVDAERRGFFGRPRIGLGEIGVHPGPALDWRPTDDGAVVHWLDHADGRYLVRSDGAAAPVSVEELAAALGRLVTLAGPDQDRTTSHTAT